MESLTSARSGKAAPSDAARSLILVYHRVAEPAHDRWHLSVSQQNFADHLHCLRQEFHPISLTDLVDDLAKGTVRHRAVAVSFDDGYLDNLTAALPLLRSAGIPATFFISGAGSVVHNSFWWEALDCGARARALSEEQIFNLHRRLMVADLVERESILAALACDPSTLPARLNDRQLLALSSDPLVEIGAHGWSHRAVGALSLEDQQQEIRLSVGLLEALIGTPPRFFAYPFGGPFTAETVQILRHSGVQAACAVEAAPVEVGCDPMMLPRIQVGDWDGDEFRRRIAALIHD